MWLPPAGKVVLHADSSVPVNSDPMPGLDAVTVNRWAPVITNVFARDSRDAARPPCGGGMMTDILHGGGQFAKSP
jgi:hypothetical protein